MRKHISMIAAILAGSLLWATGCEKRNRYDFILKNEGIKQQVALYDSKVKGEPLLMDYLNAIESSPTGLYETLKDQDCEKEILDFVKQNKSLTLKLIHIGIIIDFKKLKIADNQLIFVTNYVKSPTAMAATNAQEMGMETMVMRQMPAFLLYEAYTKPGGMKEIVESMFTDLEKRNR